MDVAVQCLNGFVLGEQAIRVTSLAAQITPQAVAPTQIETTHVDPRRAILGVLYNYMRAPISRPFNECNG